MGLPSIKLAPGMIKGGEPAETKQQNGSSQQQSVKQESKASGAGFLSEFEFAVQSDKAKKIEDFLAGKQDKVAQSKEGEVEESIYNDERLNRKLYYSEKLHTIFLELIFMLLISPNGFTLDHLYTNQFPMRILKINVPYILRLHLNHKDNVSVLGSLAHKTQKLSTSAFRMLKLFSNLFFQPAMLTDLVQFAAGAYGRVYGAKLLGEDAAVKQMDAPQSIQDRCVPHDIFTEITILDKWKADGRICRLIDFGVDDHYYWIVMKRYTTSLKDWREKQTKSLEENLVLYLNIYSDVLQNARFLEENMVNHYDIKCDNFLIYPTLDPELTKQQLYNQTSTTPNFSVCLADFGESLVYTNQKDGYSTDNRGTEFIKSPEMLTVAYAAQVERENYDRRKHAGAGATSDIWSLGCLFYELLTGEFLFYDTDWVRFFIRVTSSDSELGTLILEDRQKALNNNPDLISFLQFVLIKDVNYRPKILDVIKRFNAVKKKILAQNLKQQEEEQQLTKQKEKQQEEEQLAKQKEKQTVQEEEDRKEDQEESRPPDEDSLIVPKEPDPELKKKEENGVDCAPSSPVSVNRKSAFFPSPIGVAVTRKAMNRTNTSPARTLEKEVTYKPQVTPGGSLVGSTEEENNNPNSGNNSTEHSPGSSQETIKSITASYKLKKTKRRLSTLKFTRTKEAREPPAIAAAQKKLQNSNSLFQKSKENKDILEKERQKRLEQQQKEQREQQQKAIDAIGYIPPTFQPKELLYFDGRPTKILNYLFLGSYPISKNKSLLKRYGITHIANCTKKENPHPEHFIYINPQMVGNSDQDKHILLNFFEFVREAGKQQGRIMVVGDEQDGTGVALVLGFLMDNLRLGFFEAFQIVLSKRYVIFLQAKYIQQLLRWEKQTMQQGSFKEAYHCLCRLNVWTLLVPFDKTEHPNPITCGCLIQDPFSACPNHGCGQFCDKLIDQMDGKYSTLAWNIRYINWGYTIKDNVQANFAACEEHTPLLELDPQEREKIEEKPWIVLKCRVCRFLCYAQNRKDPSSIVIVTNFQKPKEEERLLGE